MFQKVRGIFHDSIVAPYGWVEEDVPDEQQEPKRWAPAPSPWSPPGLPGFAAAYRQCVAALIADHSPLTWESVAAWLQEHYDTPRRRRRGRTGYADLHAKTVAGWARRACLSHPREFRP
jgi:hypothetical protein